MEKHMENRVGLLVDKPSKKVWKEFVTVAEEVPHRAYTEAMGRKAHRYACLKAAQSVGEIDWKYTENDWTSLKAGDTGETMLVSVRMAIPKTEYERMKRQYIRAQMMRAAKKGGK